MKKVSHPPILIFIVLVGTALASIANANILGFSITGLAWFLPLVLSLFQLFLYPEKIMFPIKIWIPWILIIIIYLSFAEAEKAFQRSIMMLCPLIVGMAVSSLRINIKQFKEISKWIIYFSLAYLFINYLRIILIHTGILQAELRIAAQVMTASLLCVIFAIKYINGDKKALVFWIALALLPVLGGNRTAIVVTGLSFPLIIAPMKMIHRIIIISLIVSIGIGLFYSENIQRRMFHSRQGTLSDLSFDNPNINSHGRFLIWSELWYGYLEKPWLGHGTDQSGVIGTELSKAFAHPHNDWLRLLYDYGLIGTLIFGLCLSLQIMHLIKWGRKTEGQLSELFNFGATSFFIFCLFMVTDNIILYAAFFGNLQFTLIGLAYASFRKSSYEPAVQNCPYETFNKIYKVTLHRS